MAVSQCARNVATCSVPFQRCRISFSQQEIEAVLLNLYDMEADATFKHPLEHEFPSGRTLGY